jgi:hypothetical protein
MAVGSDPPGPDCPGPIAGDLFLALAADGRLQLDPEQAERLVAGLLETLEIVRARLRVIAVRPPVGHPAVGQGAVDALFADMVAPGQMEQALRELPKYIEAIRAAARNAEGSGNHSP